MQRAPAAHDPVGALRCVPGYFRSWTSSASPWTEPGVAGSSGSASAVSGSGRGVAEHVARQPLGEPEHALAGGPLAGDQVLADGLGVRRLFP
jgi:hypothetical protein